MAVLRTGMGGGSQDRAVWAVGRGTWEGKGSPAWPHIEQQRLAVPGFLSWQGYVGALFTDLGNSR